MAVGQVGLFSGLMDPTNDPSRSTASPSASSMPASVVLDSGLPAAAALSLTCCGREPPVMADATYLPVRMPCSIGEKQIHGMAPTP